MIWPKSRRPTLYASWLLLTIVGWIMMDFIEFINHFIDWRTVATRVWLEHGLSNSATSASASVFVTVAIVLALIVYHSVFKWKYYPWLLSIFGAFAPNDNIGRFIDMALVFSFTPLLFIGWATIYALHHNPIIPTLIIWAILAANEGAFRLWWRWWCKRHAAIS